ncbi:hypothetical protein I3843_14G007200 [Carya illinoinensis]|uniref:Uncharacterized protein n=2 Tax=Carya illinoinensis TaxID=32201 RepID=A0A922AGB5_CARIL|nr:bifunctional endo-1,4-beta-xylanase XylA-like isoform X1 [Carya illinoinensis]KAG6677055.1 hypothetical protein I3842_14G007100 [Carya illinoinensis]KAG7945808.1 hypothetical protein I3843_14G007200 [Carya illinoinensis]
MGNWRNRSSRRIFRHHRSPWSPPREFDHYIPPEWKDGVPLWEKKFCTLVGSIPWGKIVDTKNFMYCHNNVVSWDDSAGEEAFQNAKKRFWSKINCLRCDISLPDPDIYIDEIDWKPNIDPELIKELDQYCFVPDEEELNTQVRHKNRNSKTAVHVPSEGHNMNQEYDNPWESDNMQDSGVLENRAQGWNQRENKKNDRKTLNNDDNPWEHSSTQGNGGMMDNAWRNCGDKSWGHNQVGNYVSLSSERNNTDNTWEHGCQGAASMNDKRRGHFGKKAWGWNQQVTENLDNANNPWESRYNRSSELKDRGWKDNVANAWGWKQWDNSNNEIKHQELGRTGGGWGTWNEGCRKREGSHLYVQGTKSSRFGGDGNQRRRCWRGQTNKRVSFGREYSEIKNGLPSFY